MVVTCDIMTSEEETTMFKNVLLCRRRTAWLAAICLTLAGSFASVAASELPDSSGDNWCATEILFRQQLGEDFYKSLQDCPTYGPCDTASIRDLWIPDDTAQLTYVRMIVHILTDNNGSNPATTIAEVDSNVAHLNEDLLSSRLKVDHTIDIVRSRDWRQLAFEDSDAMQEASAVKPDSQLNVWVTETEGSSWSRMPQLAVLDWSYGCVMNIAKHWDSANSTLAHEFGHALGLLHSFAGSVWAPLCGPCHEPPEGEDNNHVGDFCHDTPPTTSLRECIDIPGNDSCTGQPWGYTMPENYMSYAPDSCYTTFTPQQAARMHCWLNDTLYNYIAWVRFSAENTYGPTGTEVAFEGVADVAADSWLWDFGDGETADVPSPIHTYQQPGVFDVTLTVQSEGQPDWWTKEAYVQIYDDTLTVDSVEYVTYEGESIRVDVYAANHIPLRELVIPFSWSGPVEMVFDSMSTAGLRTESFESASLIDFDSAGHRATVSLISSSNEYGPLLEPGDEAVVSLYFTITEATSGNYPIDIISYDTYSPQLVAYQGDYAPTSQAGNINLSLSCCKGLTGNANCDSEEAVDIGDVTEMIALLFIRVGDPFCCEDEVDLDYNGEIDIGDLTMLTSRLFITVTDPPPCP
jgi:PKD repeat protein